MRTVTFLLALAFGSLQTFSLIDCQCATVCILDAECPTCGEVSEKARVSSCCDDGSSKDEEDHSCVHINPSADGELPTDVAQAAILAGLAPDGSFGAPSAMVSEAAPRGPVRRPPLRRHLKLSVLLI